MKWLCAPLFAAAICCLGLTDDGRAGATDELSVGLAQLDGPQLGEASDAPDEQPTSNTDDIPVEDLPIDPLPAPQDDAQQTAPQQAVVLISRAEGHLADGRYELAVAEASEAIALDPENAGEYRRVRADAYLGMGHYREALADHNPLTVAIASPRATLKSGRNDVATLPRGSQLTVDTVKGDWLKVTQSGDREFDWAWVHRRDIRPGSTGVAQAPLPQEVEALRPVTPEGDETLRADPRTYRYRGENPRFDEARPPDGYYYHEGPGGDYGRRHYDWWRHVPPQYHRFLPR